MGKAIAKSSPLGELTLAAGPYAPQVRAFVQYLQSAGHDLGSGIPAYLEELKGRKYLE